MTPWTAIIRSTNFLWIQPGKLIGPSKSIYNRSLTSLTCLHDSRIKLLECLGEGAFGVVMKAEYDNNAQIQIVAVKMLRDQHTDDDVKNLVSEMEVMKRIGRHPNIINLLGCCTQNGALYVIVEYAPYKSLKDFLKQYKDRLKSAMENKRVQSSQEPCSGGDPVLQKPLYYADLMNFAYKVCLFVSENINNQRSSTCRSLWACNTWLRSDACTETWPHATSWWDRTSR